MSQAWRWGGVLVLAASLTVVGCGGGSGGGARVSTLEDDLAALESVRDDLQAEVDRLEMEAATEKEARQDAETDLAEETTARKTAESELDDERDAKQAALVDAAGLRAQVGFLTTSLEDARAEKLKAETDLAAAQTALDKAKTDSSTDLAAATSQVTALRGQVRDLTEEVADLREQLTDAEMKLAAATPATTPETPTHPGLTPDGDDTTTTPPSTTPTTTPSSQSAEASQRAARFNTELGQSGVLAPTSPVTLDLTTNGRVRLTRGSSYTAATLGDRPSTGSGLRVATLPLAGTGDAGKTVIYTDIELTRSLVEEYLPGQGETRLPLNTPVQGTGQGSPETLAVDTTTATTTIPENSANWKISHGVPTSVNAVDGNPGDNVADQPNTMLLDDLPATAMNPRRASSYSGSLHGVSGRFVCTGTNCRVQVMPDYVDTAVDEKFALEDVTLASVNPQGVAITDGQVYFVPSARLPLYTGTGNQRGADDEYMVFGFWRQNPASPASPYQFHVFADAEGGDGTIPADITAVYDGLAVGGYAERDPGAAVVTWRQGEFTADVDLSATFAGVTGTIDDFVATPTEGSSAPKTADNWLLTLAGDGNLTMPNLSGGLGRWSSELVPSRATGGTAPAITGTFTAGTTTAGTTDSLRIVGAFGTELSSTR